MYSLALHDISVAVVVSLVAFSAGECLTYANMCLKQKLTCHVCSETELSEACAMYMCHGML